MKTMKHWLAAMTGLSALLLLIFSCSKNNSSGSNPNIPPGKSQLAIYMMDDPIQFTKVLVDIRQVQVLIDTADKQDDNDRDDQWGDSYCGWHRSKEDRSVIWDTLSITPGVYDLLQLRNGADTLLGSGILPAGRILKVKITLGSDNTIYTDSVTHYPLEVFGPSPTFVINVRGRNVNAVNSNDFKLWLDFNLSRSVFFWNGEFLLKPWITVFNDVVSAKVQGTVLPRGASPLVTAYSTGDTLYAIPNRDGSYMFRGVTAGTYSINFKGRGGYQDTTITNISVDSMKVVKVPTVTLHK